MASCPNTFTRSIRFIMHANGRQMVKLYNPWGHDHVTMPYDELFPNFSGITVG